MRKLVAATCLCLCGATPCFADVVTDWNDKACAITASAGAGAAGHRLMAIVQVAVYDAVSSITGEGKPYLAVVDAPKTASIDAAVAAANRGALLALLPAEKPAIEAAYQAAMERIPAGAARDQGVQVGEKAAATAASIEAVFGASITAKYGLPSPVIELTASYTATWTIAISRWPPAPAPTLAVMAQAFSFQLVTTSAKQGVTPQSERKVAATSLRMDGLLGWGEAAPSCAAPAGRTSTLTR